MPDYSKPALKLLGGYGPAPSLGGGLPEGFSSIEEYEEYLRGLREADDVLRKRHRRVWEDEEYSKLLAEQYDTIMEMGSDTPSTVLANWESGVDATPETLYQSGTELYEFGAELFGDEETKDDARRAREAAQQLSEQTKAELTKGYGGGAVSDFAYEAGSTAAQEIPFMVGSAGVGTVARGIGKQAVKGGIRKRLAQEALEAAPAKLIGPAYVGEKLIADKIADSVSTIGTRASMTAMGLIHGSRSAGGTFGEATDKLHSQYFKALQAENPEMPWQELDQMAYKQARESAVAPAIASGVITAGLMTAFGATGVERFFANPTKSRPAMLQFFEAFGFEATEEGADQFLQGVLAKHSYDPSRSWDSVIAETAHASLLGGVIGVKMGGARILADKAFEFGDAAPITNRLADWADRRAGGRVKDREAIQKWLEDHTDVSDSNEAAESAAGMSDGIQRIKGKLAKAAQGKPEPEAEAESAREQRIPEEELDQLEDEGVNVTPERDKQEELSVHRSRGKAAAQEKVEKPEEIAAQIEEEVGGEAAEQFVEGYNEVELEEDAGDGNVSAARLWAKSLIEEGIPNAEEINRTASIIRETSEEAEVAFLEELAKAETAPTEEPEGEPEPASEAKLARYEKGSRSNIENAGGDLGKRAAVAHGVRKGKKFEGASQEFKDYVNGIIQEAEAAGYELRDKTGDKWNEGHVAIVERVIPATEADEALRLEDGEHGVISKVHSPAVFKDGKLVEGGMPTYDVVVFGPKSVTEQAEGELEMGVTNKTLAQKLYEIKEKIYTAGEDLSGLTVGDMAVAAKRFWAVAKDDRRQSYKTPAGVDKAVLGEAIMQRVDGYESLIDRAYEILIRDNPELGRIALNPEQTPGEVNWGQKEDIVLGALSDYNIADIEYFTTAERIEEAEGEPDPRADQGVGRFIAPEARERLDWTRRPSWAPADTLPEEDPNQEDFMGLMMTQVEDTVSDEAAEQGEVGTRSMDLFEQAQQQVVNEDRDVFGPPAPRSQRELELGEMEEGQERGSVDLPRMQGPPAPDPQRELTQGEEVEPEYKRIQQEGKEAPEGQFVLSVQRPPREGKPHYDKVDGYWAEGSVYIDRKYRDNSKDAYLKHNRKEKTLDIGYYERGRFVPTHRLRDHSQVKESAQQRKDRTGRLSRRGWFVQKTLFSDKNLANADIWELAPAMAISPKIEKAKAAQMGEAELARRTVTHVKNEALREALQLMASNGHLGVESINAVILAANKYRKKGVVNPRTLSDRGNVELLAKKLVESINILKNPKLFADTIIAGDPRKKFNEDSLSELTKGLEAPTNLTVDDLKLVDKGRADEEMPVADWATVPNGKTIGFKSAVTKGKKGLAPIVFKTQTESKGVTVNRVEVGLVNPERIPLGQLQSNLNEVYKGKGVEFSINRSGESATISVSGKTDALTDEAVEGIQGIIAYVNMKAKKAPVTEKYQKVIAKRERISREDNIIKEHGVYSPKGVKTKQRKRRGKPEGITENDKKILTDGGAVLDYWTKKGDESSEADQLALRGKQPFKKGGKSWTEQSLLAPSVLNDQAAKRVSAYNQNKNNRDNQLLLSYKEKKDKPVPKITTLKIEKGQLDEGVERYTLDGKNVYIIKDKRSGRFYYSIGARPTTSNPGTAMEETIKRPLQAKNFIVGQINNLNKGLKFAGLSLLIGKSRDAKGQEQQQGVGLDVLDRGGSFAATPTSAQNVEEGTKDTPAEEKLTEEEIEERRNTRWRDANQPSDPMPEVEGVQPQGDQATEDWHQARIQRGEMRKGYVQEINSDGKRILIPKRKQFNNEFRASVGLAPVTKIKGKWHRASQPIELTEEQKDPSRLNVVSESEAASYWSPPKGEEKPAGQRVKETPLPPKDSENVELTEEEFAAVQAHIESFKGGLPEFINNILGVLDSNPRLINQLQKLVNATAKQAEAFIAEARQEAIKGTQFGEGIGPKPRQSLAARKRSQELHRKADELEAALPFSFKQVLSPDNKKRLTAWAKEVSPNNWKAVLEYAEEIYKEAESAPNRKLRAKAAKAEKEAVQVPNDLPVAKGAVALKELVSRADNGLTEEQRIAALRFLDKIDPELLDNLSLNISSELNVDGDTEVAYEGEFNSLENIINLASDTATDENTLLEEIAHFTAKLLPSNLRQKAISLHKKSVASEISKNEKQLEQAKGDDRVRLLSNLSVLRNIQSRGQITSDEFRSILPKESEVGAENFSRIVEDTYHLANADEFYANAMVTRVGESEFSRGRQILNSILDAIAAAFGNTNAQVNRFVSKAKKTLSTPGRANKKMGGMLMRGNINAKSVKVLTNQAKLAGAVSTDLAKADMAEETGKSGDAAKLRQRANDRASQAGAVTSLFDKIIRKIIPGLDNTSRVARLIKAHDMGYIQNLVDSLPSSSEYMQTIQRFQDEGRPELAQATALYAFQFIKEMENRATRLRHVADKQAAKVSGSSFKAAVRSAQAAAKRAVDSASLTSEISKTLQVALAGATKPEPEVSLLAQMIGSVENLEAAISSVPELSEAMKKLSNILSMNPEGLELFRRPDIHEQFYDSAEIVRLSNEVYNYVTNLGVKKEDENLWRTASALFIANKSIRTNAIIESMPFIEAKKEADKLVEQIYDAISSGDIEVRKEKIAEMFNEVTELSSQEGRTRFVAQQRMKSVVKELRLAADLEQAANAAEQVINDPEIVEYRRLSGLQARVDDRPELVSDHFYEDFTNGTIYIPKPPDALNPDAVEGNIVKISLLPGEMGNENIKKAHNAAKDIQRWLDSELENNSDENGNPKSPYWGYYWNTLQQLHSTFVNELVWNTPTNQRGVFRNTFFGVLGHLVDNLPTRGAKIARRAIDKHDMYYTWFDDWRSRHKAKWTNLLLKAAKSRKDRFADDTSFSLRESKVEQKARGVANWERHVGRYLRDSWQEGGMTYGAGELLPNGEIVTQEDIELIYYEDFITDEAYKFNEGIASKDDSVQPLRVTDTAVRGKGIKRMALKRGKAMLPRKFSHDGRSFIEKYAHATDKGLTGKALFDSVFDGDNGTQALISFITDRNPEWVTASGRDASVNEMLYGLIGEEIRDGSLMLLEDETDLSAQSIAVRLATAAGVSVETGSEEGGLSMKEQLMEEFIPVLDNLKEKFKPENNNATPIIQIAKTEGISPMTEGRLDKVAPSFFYSLGYNNEMDFQSFVSNGQLPLAQSVVKALKSANDEIERLLKVGEFEALTQKYMKKFGKDRYHPKVQKAVASEIGVAATGGDQVEDYLRKKSKYLKQYTSDFDKVYGDGGLSDYTVESMPNIAQRAWGATIGGILANTMTTTRNFTDTLINGALAVQMLQGGTGVAPVLYTILRGLMVNVIKMGSSFVVSGSKIAVYKLPILGTWKAVRRGTGTDGHPASLYGAIRMFFVPTVEELSNVMPSRTSEYKMLREQGLGMPTTPEQTSINFDELLETGGRILSDPETSDASAFKSIPKRILWNGVGAWEAGIQVLLSPLMQRMGDLAANNLLANLAQSVGHNMERKARLAYAKRVELGISMDEKLAPEDVLGNFLGVMKANGVTYDEARSFLAKSGVTNIEQQVRDYWQKLAAAPDKAARKKIRLFKQEQLDRMAATMVMSNNIAAPSNRPLWQKKSRLNSVMFALTGWSFNQLQNWSRMINRTGKESKSEQGKRHLQMMIFLAASTGFQVPDNWLLEWMNRLMDEGLYGRRRITRLPNETAGWQQPGLQRDEALAWGALATQSVPLVGSSFHALWNDLPGRAQHAPAALLLNQTRTVYDFFANSYKTGRPDMAFVDSVNRLLPISRAVTYRVSKYQQNKVLNDNAKRAIRATYSDSNAVEPIKGGMLGSKLDEFTPYRQEWAAAVAGGDWKEARRLYDEAIVVYQDVSEDRTGRKISLKQAEKNLKSSFNSANPVSQALRYKPDRQTFFENIEHATESDKNYIKSNLKQWEKAVGMFGLADIFAKSKSPSSMFVSPPRSTSRRRSSGRRALRPR